MDHLPRHPGTPDSGAPGFPLATPMSIIDEGHRDIAFIGLHAALLGLENRLQRAEHFLQVVVVSDRPKTAWPFPWEQPFADRVSARRRAQLRRMSQRRRTRSCTPQAPASLQSMEHDSKMATMIERILSSALRDAPANTPTVALVGPRDAGKTTRALAPFGVLEVGDRSTHEDSDRVATQVQAIPLAALARELRLACAATPALAATGSSTGASRRRR